MWALFLLWLSLFIPSGAIPLVFSSNILDTYQPGEFRFQYPIILPSHTVHGVLKARILKWHPLLQWATFYQTSPLGPVCLQWPYTAWLIVSLS